MVHLEKTHVYGYGGFLVHDGVKELQGSGMRMASQKSGEVFNMAAIELNMENCPFTTEQEALEYKREQA